MSDIVERLRRKVFRGPTMEASHTKTVEWKAAAEIERLREAMTDLLWYVAQLETLAYDKDDAGEHESVTRARAALKENSDE